MADNTESIEKRYDFMQRVDSAVQTAYSCIDDENVFCYTVKKLADVVKYSQYYKSCVHTTSLMKKILIMCISALSIIYTAFTVILIISFPLMAGASAEGNGTLFYIIATILSGIFAGALWGLRQYLLED